MGRIANLLLAAILGLFSASLAVIYQNEIAGFFGRAPITAKVDIGPWYPFYAREGGPHYSKQDDEAIGEISDPRELSFARVHIKNRSASKIDSVIFSVDDVNLESSSPYHFHAVVLRGGGKTASRSFYDDASHNINFGSLEAAQSLTAYVWSNRTFSYPHDPSDIVILTSNGNAVTSANRYSGDVGSFIFDVETEFIAWVIVFVTLFISFLTYFYANHFFNFIKLVLKDDDYYLSEKIRYEEDPQKYIVPESLPKQ